MNTDFRLSTGIFEHPKVLKLGRRLGDTAVLSYLRLLRFVAVNHPDGSLRGLDAEDVAIAAGFPGDAAAFQGALVEVRLLDGDPGRLSVHDWSDHNPYASGAPRRSQVAREGAGAKWATPPDAATPAEDSAPAPAPNSQPPNSPRARLALQRKNAKLRSERLAEARRKGTHTEAEWEAMVAEFGGACVRCGRAGGDVRVVKDHILPVYQGGSDGLDNLQPLCKPCNSGKGPESTDWRPEARRRLALSTPAVQTETPANTAHDACETSAQPVKTSATLPKTSPPSPSPSYLPSASDSYQPSNPPTTTLLPSDVRAPDTPPLVETPDVVDPACQEEVVALLLRNGISEGSARSLAARRPCDAIRQQVEDLPDRIADMAAKGKSVLDPAGLLFKAVFEGYGRPEGAKRRAAEERATRDGREAEGRRRQQQADRDAVAAQDALRLQEEFAALSEEAQAGVLDLARARLLENSRFFQERKAKDPDRWWQGSGAATALLTARNAILAEGIHAEGIHAETVTGAEETIRQGVAVDIA